MAIHTGANPSAAPVAGGATTPNSRFGGARWQGHFFRFLARLGRHLTGMAYRRLQRLEKERIASPDHHDHRAGPAGTPSRAAGGPAPHQG